MAGSRGNHHWGHAPTSRPSAGGSPIFRWNRTAFFGTFFDLLHFTSRWPQTLRSARQPSRLPRRRNARADVLPPSGKLTRSRSASGLSRRSQDFSSTYSSGPIGALPRHTIARTRPSITHQHVARSHQPSEACPLTTSLAPFRADRVTCATTFLGLASASAEALPRRARGDMRISSCST